MSEGDAPGRLRIPHRQALRSKEEGCPAASRLQPLADPDHPDRTPCPPNSSVRRTGFGVASGRTLQTTAPADDPLFRRSAPMRVAGSQPPCRRRDDGLDLSREYAGDAATGLLRKGLSPMARNDGGERVGLRPEPGERLAPPGPGDCRVHSGSASRSSSVMRASTALRMSGPASFSMALQSAALWMVATVPRSMS